MNKKRDLLEFFLMFILAFIFSMVFHTLSNDEIWNYGFAYNISTGLVPYRDYNVVTTPLYPIIDAIFMILFGKNVIVHYIFSSIICAKIFLYIKKNNPQSYYLLYAILLFFAAPTYNLICLLLFYILINFEENKKNDYLIGIILGLTFLTKQNIGIYLCIPTLFTKNITKILKRIAGFLAPNVIFLVYLIYNNALYQFIDYCFLGVSEFATNNKLITIPSLICLILSIIYLIYKYIKTKDIKLIYMLCLFGMSYPIIDPYHVIIPFIPTLGYVLNKINVDKRIIRIAFIVFVSIVSTYNIYEYSPHGNYSFPNTLHTFKYNRIDNYSAKQINILTTFAKNNGKNTFDLDASGYLIKLENGIPIDKHDYFLTGNIGKKGSNKLIADFNDICKEEKCTFIINQYAYDTQIYSQYNRKLHEYVVNNYKYSETIEGVGLQVYRNYEKKSDEND